MWKDFFYFSRAERRLLVSLLVLAAVLAGVLWCYEHCRLPKSEGLEDEALTAFRVSVAKNDSLRRLGRQMQESSGRRRSKVVLFPFDPNVADSARLAQLGLSDFVVRNVLKYRARGGKFRTPESFAKIYGLSDGEFRRVLPYIRIQEEMPVSEVTVSSSVEDVQPMAPPRRPRVQKYAEGTMVDLNEADTASLKRVPGIGRGRAAQIVAYRRRLGGYYTVDQLAEIQGMPDSVVRWFKIGHMPEKSLRINRWSVDRLRQHPYLNFYQAKVIVEHRHKYGPLDSLPQLRLYEEFATKDLERLRFYVSFD